MKRILLLLLVAFGLMVPQVQATEGYEENACERGISKIKDTIPGDGVYEIDARWTFRLNIRKGKVRSFIDLSSDTELLSKIVEVKFFPITNFEEANRFFNSRTNKGYWFLELARMRRYGEEEFSYYAVIVANMNCVWVDTTTDD